MNKIIITTDIHRSGKIYQWTKSISSEVPQAETIIMQQVIDTQDIQINDALIKLGWTPPMEFTELDPIKKSQDNKTECLIRFHKVGDEVGAFKEAFRLCLLHYGNHGPEKVNWFIGGILFPHEARDPLGRCGFVRWVAR